MAKNGHANASQYYIYMYIVLCISSHNFDLLLQFPFELPVQCYIFQRLAAAIMSYYYLAATHGTRGARTPGA